MDYDQHVMVKTSLMHMQRGRVSKSRVETRPPEIVFTGVNTGVGNYFQSAIVQPLLDIIGLHITPSARIHDIARSRGEGFPVLVWPPDMTHSKGIGVPKRA